MGSYALWDKLNEWFGGRLPKTNAEKTNAKLKELAKETGTPIMFNNHSRGSLTDKVSTAYLQNVKGITDILIEKTKYLGPAANIKGEYDMLEKNNYVDKHGISNTLFLGNNNTDFVGRLVGLNPVTAGNCTGNPLGSCYSHSSYNGAYYLEPFLLNENGKVYIDKNSKLPIKNPEFDKIKDSVIKPKLDQNGQYINPTLAQAIAIGKDGNINLVDRQGNMTTYDKKTLKPIKTTQIPNHEINGKRYFNYGGKKYYADPPK